jgi:hypothetical protein
MGSQSCAGMAYNYSIHLLQHIKETLKTGFMGIPVLQSPSDRNFHPKVLGKVLRNWEYHSLQFFTRVRQRSVIGTSGIPGMAIHHSVALYSTVAP